MKSIVLLGGGPEQADAIKISKELGYNTIVLDSNLLAVGRKFADKFIQCDIKNSSEVFRNIENLGVNGLMVHAIELSNVVAEVSDQISVGKNRNEAMQRAERARDLINVKTI